MAICVSCKVPIATIEEEKKSLRGLLKMIGEYPPNSEPDWEIHTRIMRRTDELLRFGRGCYSNMCCVCSVLYDVVNNSPYFKRVHDLELRKKAELTDPEYGIGA